jgi:GH15 family glucan-1,4-alpha-glucosidase
MAGRFTGPEISLNQYDLNELCQPGAARELRNVASTLDARTPTSQAPPISIPPRIEDHGLIGDMRTAALVTKGGSIDWLCLPAFDSDACFAALLGTASNGHWTIAPTVPVREIRRRYRNDTLILETDFVTDSGTVRLVDFMPPRRGRGHSQVCRSLRCIEGSVPVRSEVSPRLAFGRAVPRILSMDGATKLYAGPDALYLRGGPTSGFPSLVADFVISGQEKVPYSLTYGSSHEALPRTEGVDQAERATEEFWTRWCSTLHAPAEYRDLVIRSLITLKACIYEPTGGIVAAPTSSLPETPRGLRNWDYRYCWLRDGALSLRSLMLAGLRHEAQAFFEWMLRAIAGDPAQVQIMYGIRGERRLSEVELNWLEGYEGARPVRVGNAAFDQRQLDVFGEVAIVLFEASQRFRAHRPEAVRALMNIARYVASAWRLPDRGIWEMRGPERSFTASKVAAWAALDRAIRYAEEHGINESVDDLREARTVIFEEVCCKGFNSNLNSFTQYYGGTGLDASLLFIPLSGFLPATDARVVGTVAALERELLHDGLLLRFKPEADVDGLTGEEGVFLACSFWLVAVYQMMGRKEDARTLFERAASTRNDLGLLAEEYHTKERRQLGNFPQAFSHFALVSAAFALAEGEPVVPGST